MIKYNILPDSFITNPTTSGQRVLTALEVSNLIAESGNVATISGGSTVNLLIDLGAQRSVDSLRYTFSPISTSGLVIQYGREANSLVSGTVSVQGNTIVVTPTQSGYTYPRFFAVTHSVSGSAVTLSGLSVLNNDTEINFGTSGTVNALTIVSSGISGLSQVLEVPVYNNGIVPADIYVGLDTTGMDLDLVDRFQLSTTSTGTFETINTAMEMPTEIPWEWGVLSGVSINSSNELILDDPSFSFPTYTLGQYIQIATSPNFNDNQPTPILLPNGSHAIACTDSSNRIILVDPIRSSVTQSPLPPIVPSTSSEYNNHQLAWDGSNKLFYINNSATDQNLRYYDLNTNTHQILTTIPFFIRSCRMLAVCNGNLYVGGAQSSSGSSGDRGNQFWRLNLTTLVWTQLSNLPTSPDANGMFAVLENCIYYMRWPNGTALFRFDIALNVWQTLTAPSGSFFQGIFPYATGKQLWIADNSDNIKVFSHVTGTYLANAYSSLYPGGNSFTHACLCANDTLVFNHRNDAFTVASYVLVRDTNVPAPVINLTASGTYLSPVLKMDQDEKYHRMILDYALGSVNNLLKADPNIAVDNFEFRGSDTSPASDNTIEEFDEGIDEDSFVTGTLGSTTVTASGGFLTFSHDYLNSTDTPHQSAYLTFGFPLSSAGEMQYKFWWNPASNRTANSTNWSGFYIAPYIDTIGTGNQPDRNPDTLQRLTDDHIYIRFGSAANSGGSFTQLQFYNGSTTTAYSISASTGTFYDVTLIVNWSTGAYRLYFKGAFLGAGTIPTARIALIGDTHTYEIFSASDGVDSQEQFKHLTINRVGTESAELTDIAIPLHARDPLFGEAGTLPWYITTVNGSLIPKYKYIQFRLTFRSSGTLSQAKVSGIRFPVIQKLEQVPVSGTKSVFVRYNFPVNNNLGTNVFKLKSWMATDKL